MAVKKRSEIQCVMHRQRFYDERGIPLLSGGMTGDSRLIQLKTTLYDS